MTVDGKALGEIDVGAPASLVTLEPNVCHVLQEVAYGSGVETKPSIRFPAKSVVSVPEYPL